MRLLPFAGGILTALETIRTFGQGASQGTSLPAAGAPSRENDPFGGRFYRGIDEASLRQIAKMTGGEYYTASSDDGLQRVLDGLPTALITREETTEITFGFTAFAALLASLAFILSQLWRPLP
jgi:Ca-activated chloride channel family protein